MTRRDCAQGAYRMRGIGIGQRINVLVVPEVGELMRPPTPSYDAEMRHSPSCNGCVGYRWRS